MPPLDGVVSTDTPAAATETPGASTVAPGSSASAAAVESADDLFPTVFEPAKPTAAVTEEEFTPDLKGLPPELVAKAEEIRRGFQSAETRKLQKLADDRRSWEEQRRLQLDKISEMTDRLTKALEPKAATTETPSAEPDPMSQIRELQENGQIEEANALMMKVLEQRVDERLDPINKAREQEARVNTFLTTKDAVFEQDPAVKRYKEEVIKVWDDPGNPVMRMLRSEVLQSPDRIQKFVPVIMRAIAMERHAQTLEANFEKAVKAGVDRELAKMKGLPSKLVETGGASKETRTETSDRRAAVLRALDKLTAAQTN